MTESVIANGSTKKSESTTSELRDLTNIALSNDVDSEPEPQEKRADDAEVIDEKNLNKENSIMMTNLQRMRNL